jgi:SAM-dependent methyltransferase
MGLNEIYSFQIKQLIQVREVFAITKIEPYKGIAGIYEEIRPSYPEQLIQDIISITNLKSEDILLEIGAGTGKATIQFANKGFRIHAVEIGEDMAVILRKKCSAYTNVTIDVASFEEWTCKEDLAYDMIYSAQAFHWINKDIKYRRCHELLKDNGYLVLFWYQPTGCKTPERIEIDDQVDILVSRYTSKVTTIKEGPERLVHTGVASDEDRKKEIDESGLFRIVSELNYTFRTRNNPEQYLNVMKSVPSYASVLDRIDSDIIKKMDSEIEELINQHGGYTEEEFLYSLYIAQKIVR